MHRCVLAIGPQARGQHGRPQVCKAQRSAGANARSPADDECVAPFEKFRCKSHLTSSPWGATRTFTWSLSEIRASNPRGTACVSDTFRVTIADGSMSPLAVHAISVGKTSR
ncbi:hypothetical protein D9M68_967250 [compost metagenome]